MKLLCLVSIRVSEPEGHYRDFTAGQVYDLPETFDAGDHFARPENPSPTRRRGRSEGEA